MLFVCILSGRSAEDCPLYRAHGQTELALLQRGAPLLKLRLCLSLEGRWIKLLSFMLFLLTCVCVCVSFTTLLDVGYNVTSLLTFPLHSWFLAWRGFGEDKTSSPFCTAWSGSWRINCHTKPRENITSQRTKHLCVSGCLQSVQGVDTFLLWFSF